MNLSLLDRFFDLDVMVYLYFVDVNGILVEKGINGLDNFFRISNP